MKASEGGDCRSRFGKMGRALFALVFTVSLMPAVPGTAYADSESSGQAVEEQAVDQAGQAAPEVQTAGEQPAADQPAGQQEAEQAAEQAEQAVSEQASSIDSAEATAPVSPRPSGAGSLFTTSASPLGTGTVYAVFSTTTQKVGSKSYPANTLFFLRSSQVISDGTSATVKSVSNPSVSVTGTVYAVSESKDYKVTYNDEARCYLSDAPWEAFRGKAVRAVLLDSIKPKSASGWFAGFSKLESIEGLEKLDLSAARSASSLFENCSSLSSIDVSEFDMSNIVEAGGMFSGCSSLTSLDVSKWRFSKVWSLYSMFKGCKNLKNLDVSKWDVSHAYMLSSMFDGCSSLTSLDVSNWNTSKADNMERMFSGCTSLKALDVSKWDVSNVEYIRDAFYGCSSLESLDVSNWKFGNVTKLDDMFYGCSSLKSLDVSNWDVSNITDMRSLFSGCTSLKALDVSKWDVSKARCLDSIFARCSSITSLDLSKWDLSNATDLDSMFIECTSLSNLKLFKGGKMKATDISFMFYGCKNLASIDVSVFNVSNVTDMSSIFEGCSSLKYLDLSNWDTSNADCTDGMFDECTSLAKVKLGSKFRFEGNCGRSSDYWACLPVPTASGYSGRWCLEDCSCPQTVTELKFGFPSSTAPAGTWVWEKGEKPVARPNAWKRISGSDRYETGSKLVSEKWRDGSASTILLATGDNYPDALAAGPLAGLLKAPLLTTSSKKLSPSVRTEIERVRSSSGCKVLIIGGKGAVSDSVAAEVDSIDGVSVERISGATRFETAEKIYSYGCSHGGWGRTAIVASGNNYPDALSAAPYGYCAKAPIFLADKGKLGKSTAALVKGKFSTLLILGGSSAVDAESVEADFGSSTACGVFSGATRYETSSMFCVWSCGGSVDGIGIRALPQLTYSNLTVASGKDFPDALSAVSLAGRPWSPILLVSDKDLGVIEDVVTENKGNIFQGYIAGGKKAVSINIEAKLNAWMGIE
ncbi:MAG: BspA family leucine-rich repeat surface protein [Coriobacteriales bacterium]|jgi:surface protein